MDRRPMETLRLGTWIDAPVERCFLLSLSVDLHVASARSTRGEPVAETGQVMIGEGETLTFRGTSLWRPLAAHQPDRNAATPYLLSRRHDRRTVPALRA